MKFSRSVYLVKDYCCASFRNQQSFLTRLKYDTKIAIFANHYFLLYSRRWEKKKKKKKKNELRLGAGIILNQVLT